MQLLSSKVKTRPPTPGTPEYDELEPVTFAKCIWFLYHIYITNKDCFG